MHLRPGRETWWFIWVLLEWPIKLNQPAGGEIRKWQTIVDNVKTVPGFMLEALRCLSDYTMTGESQHDESPPDEIWLFVWVRLSSNSLSSAASWASTSRLAPGLDRARSITMTVLAPGDRPRTKFSKRTSPCANPCWWISFRALSAATWIADDTSAMWGIQLYTLQLTNNFQSSWAAQKSLRLKSNKLTDGWQWRPL